MNKKRWIVVFVLAVAAALCIFIFPRKAERVLDLSQGKVESIFVTTTKGTDDPQRHTTTDKEEIAAAMACLQELRLHYPETSDIYSYRSGEDARVVVRYSDGGEVVFTFAVSGEVRRERKNYQAVDNAPLEELMAQIKGWKESPALPRYISGKLYDGRSLDEIPFRTEDPEEIAAAMALLRELQAKRTFDDNSVTFLNDAYYAKIDLAYVHGAARFEVGEWGWLRYREQNYMAQDPAVTKELLELVKSWKIS